MGTRFAHPGRIGRPFMAAAMGLLLLASSTSAAEPSARPTADEQVAASPTPAISGVANGPIHSVTTPVPADPGYVEQVMAVGLDKVTAEFMAQTLSTVEVIDAHGYAVHHAFPNGATGDVTYQLAEAADMSPGDPPRFSGEVVADEYRYTLRYAIDVADLPSDLRAQLLDGLPTVTVTAYRPTSGSLRSLGTPPVRPIRANLTADSPSTIEVVANGVISQGKGKVIDTWLKKADLPKTTKVYKAYKAGKKVWEAVELNGTFADALAELRALEDCAEDPTNPLTKKAYTEDPQEKQRVLDDLTRSQSDTRSSIMVTFTSMLTDTGSSLIKAAPWLKFVTGPANDYVKATNLALVKSYLDEAEQRVVPCDQSYRVKGSVPSNPGGISLSGTACSLKQPFTVKTGGDLIGAVEFRPTSDAGGTWDYRGRVRTAPFNVDGSGTYNITLSDDKSSGTLHFVFVLTIHIPEIGSKTAGGSAHLTLTEVPRCAE